ncbi:hypothetical protein PSPO01_16211 [Paraphaeosphaeria sporulosa]
MSIISTFLPWLSSLLLPIVHHPSAGASVRIDAAVALHLFKPTLFGGGDIATRTSIWLILNPFSIAGTLLAPRDSLQRGFVKAARSHHEGTGASTALGVVTSSGLPGSS